MTHKIPGLDYATVITRRTYSVPGPNSLWHIDGHHSLINWGLVIHGHIDGFSRLICFLKCGTNNKKQTVEALFLEATEKYSWPSRIRTDHGGENVLVWQHMIEKRGEGRGSVLSGSSTQNQRIERLWRDLFRCVCSTFYYTFVAMEEEGILDRDNDLHKFILYFVFLPRINVAIDSFVNAWNRHPMRTEHNWSPEQMWVNGMVDSTNRHLLAVADSASLHFRCGACAWITRGYCVMVSSVYLLKFKIIETCLFLALFCLCFFVILMALFKSYFLLISSFFNRIILLKFFYLCIDHYIVRSAF